MTDFVSPLLAAGNTITTMLAEARAVNRTAAQALMTYSAAIEHGIQALLNETRQILVIAVTDLEDDGSMGELHRRIFSYLHVHNLYEPLLMAKAEAEAALDRLDARAERLRGMADMSGRKRDALGTYRTEFLEVLGFIDELEYATKYLPAATGLLATTMLELSDISGLSTDERICCRERVADLSENGLLELDQASLTQMPQRLVPARHKIVMAFGG